MAVRASVADTIEAVYQEEAGRLWRALYAFAADGEIASDAVAEAFAQAIRRGDAIRDARAWVWRSGFRIAAGELKRRARSIDLVGYEGNPGAVLPTGSVLAIVDVASGQTTIAGEFAQTDGFLHSYPRWSPDGSAFVINVDHIVGDEPIGSTVAIIRQTDAGWSEPVAITEVGNWTRPDWHPSDDLIVFCTYDIGAFQSTDEPSNLFTIRPDGTELTQITDFGPGEERATQPTWTSDGRIIFTYITGAADEQRNVAFIDADGSGLEIVSADDDVGENNRPHPRLRPAP